MSTDSNWKDINNDFLNSKEWVESFLYDKKVFVIGSSQLDYREKSEKNLLVFKKVLDLFENPQNSFNTIHIAGTSGKGSTTSIIDAILTEVNLKTGRYTSPYMQIPNEKLIFDGKMIKPSELTQIINSIKTRLIESNDTAWKDLTYSTMWLLIAFMYFKKSNVSVAALETSVGGRFDSTNIVSSAVSVITNISYDHMAVLGNTLEEIAWHKAGIIKTGKPVVTTETNEVSLNVIIKEAKEKGSPIYILNKDFFVSNIKLERNGVYFDLKTPFNNFTSLYINLSGEFQAYNAAAAIMSVYLASEELGFFIDEKIIRNSLRNISYPGRLEKMQDDPIVIIDGAHNPAKMEASINSLKKQYKSMDIILVIGMIKSKDAAGTLDKILGVSSNVITTSPHVKGKVSFTSVEMKELIQTINPTVPVEAFESPEDAVKRAIEIAGKDNIVFVTGSIYMMEHVRCIWHPVEKILKNLEYS